MQTLLRTLLHEEQSVEHDSFREGNGQDRLDQDFRRRAGIASHRLRSLHADEAHAEGRAKRRQTDVNVSAQFCQHWHQQHICYLSLLSRRLPRLNTVEPPKFLISVMRRL